MGMGPAVDRLIVKLARVVVPPYMRERNGHIENVGGYSYDRKGSITRTVQRQPLRSRSASGYLFEGVPGHPIVPGRTTSVPPAWDTTPERRAMYLDALAHSSRKWKLSYDDEQLHLQRDSTRISSYAPEITEGLRADGTPRPSRWTLSIYGLYRGRFHTIEEAVKAARTRQYDVPLSG